MRTGPRLAAWLDLGAVREVSLQPPHVLVIDDGDLVGAEGAYLPLGSVAALILTAGSLRPAAAALLLLLCHGNS